mmetsp:Transcript_14539/g.16494  ORF Transcript_14539/g.16494 Transcript_14539/m.16494 type:complete len:144 (+) Transcript_14539:3065-3496(+)|eukprot:CAMPEP_0184018658 /NCGR_PEP_ID=MMETSP0954-20121128/8274_1 /TAXON_ID=627963 /ORGANISM="Aplanochytrium sp, Strain PBS07" /LENGTH=143 /DNA_ID=CAMNT_0026300149 /DNA_START=1561 /DNA_END=1992 /DNA_ORIENTATION=-
MVLFTTSNLLELSPLFDDVVELPKLKKRNLSAHRHLRMDMVENEDGYVAVYEIPGVKKEDVNINLEGRDLKVSAKYADEHSNEDEKDNSTIHWRERTVGEFSRSVRLPNNVDLSSIEAKQEDGLLTLSMKKKPEAVPRKIEIN